MQFETMRFTVACRIFLLHVLFNFIETKEVIWRFDSDISNPDNWIDGKLAEGCTGIHFSRVNSAPVYIKGLTTGELELPYDGSVIFEMDANIELKDNRKCIKLKPIDVHDWEDPHSWSHPDNVAIPDKERVPCIFDDVIFPNTRYIDLHFHKLTKVRSMKTKEGAKLELHNFHANIAPCNDPYGCLCHDEPLVCYPNQEEEPKCANPIVPEESCHGICGAYLTYKPGKGPKLEEVNKKLKEYGVDTYASRVKDYLGGEVVQVVFGEKDYTGRSVEEAEKFREFLEEMKAEKIQMFRSGKPLVDRGHGVGIVFGSLLGVVVFFGILFYINGRPSVMEVVVSRFSRGRGSIFSTPFFARFDTTDENLILDGHSESGSVLDIPKSFDNPMYDQPSTTDHENPLYEVTKDIEE